VPASRPALVEPGQAEEVLDEQPHAAGFGLDAAQDARDLVGLACGALAVQLGEAPDGRERRPQLVAGVADEPAHPALGGACLRLGRFLRGVRRLEAVDHDVERRGQAAHLGALVSGRYPDAVVAGGDGLRGRLDLHQRLQAAPHRVGSERTSADERDESGGCVDQQQPRHRVVDAVERQQQDGPSAAWRSRSDGPPAVVAVDGADGHGSVAEAQQRAGPQVGFGTAEVTVGGRQLPTGGVEADDVDSQVTSSVTAAAAAVADGCVGRCRDREAGGGDELAVEPVDEVLPQRCGPGDGARGDGERHGDQDQRQHLGA
jgi:hypothetical protein